MSALPTVLHRVFTVSKGEDGRTIVTASTADVDRMDDIIDQASWKLENFNANPVILWMHDPYSHPPIGRGEVTIEGGALKAAITWDEGDDLGKEVARKFREGFLHSVSVGFRPGARSISRKQLATDHPWYKADGYGCVYYDCDLLEISAVGIPANPKATTAKSDGDPDEVAALRDEVRALREQVAALRAMSTDHAASIVELRALAAIEPDTGGGDDTEDTDEDTATKAIIASMREAGLLA